MGLIYGVYGGRSDGFQPGKKQIIQSPNVC